MCSDLDFGTKYVDIKHNGQWKIVENKVHTCFWEPSIYNRKVCGTRQRIFLRMVDEYCLWWYSISETKAVHQNNYKLLL